MDGRPLGIAVVGLGFMGRTHLAAWRRAAADGYPVRVVAVHDRAGGDAGLAAAAGGNLDTGANAGPDAAAGPAPDVVADLDELLARDDVDVVSLCTPTDTHVELGERVIAAGHHLLIEKPVAIRAADVARLHAAAAARPELVVMPAMCMRFWPGWTELRDLVRTRGHGDVRACSFFRQGSPPDWNAGFYRDPDRSGAALFDLHVHDVDVVHACFGPPAAVTSTGSTEHVTTIYHYGSGGPSEVTATGSWALPPSAGFRMRYLAVFERAAAEFDLAAPEPLVLHGPHGSVPVSLAAGAGYDGEVRHLAEVLVRRRAGADVQPDASLADALTVTRTLEAEFESLATGRTVELAFPRG
jgi:predicted dehydrogenase